MDIFAAYVDLINQSLHLIGMTHAMAHVHGGLAIYLGVQTLLRTRRASAIALQAVLGAELVNEILERGYYGSWRWHDTLGDIAMTMLWPTALYLLSRYRRARWEQWQAKQRRQADSAGVLLARAASRSN